MSLVLALISGTFRVLKQLVVVVMGDRETFLEPR